MRILRFIRVTTIIFLSIFHCYGQDRTVGTITITDAVDDGYTLFSPTSFNKTYLVNNCGQVINEWTSEYDAGLMAYLLEDGRLLRAGKTDAEFGAGGAGGIIELFSWVGDLLWSYEFSDNRLQHHHDIEYLPNGNILVMVWVKLTEAEIIDTGRNPSFIQANRGLWTERVIEIMPVGTDDAEIVWQWDAYDHLIQDADPGANNFGIVEDHPELIDANYPYFSISSGDWMHFNSIDYNEDLDQIILSSRTFSELYIIDHSTTTEEAASHIGGRYGKGGDILYRWGNPQAYKRGTEDDKVLFGQHDPHFVEIDNENNDKIMIFNNGSGQNSSTVDIIQTEHNNGFYSIDSTEAYGPEFTYRTIKSNDDINFDSPRISGAQQLPNGNVLICSGNMYKILEVTPTGELAWLYENPVGNFGPQPQGTNGGGRDIFRAHKYAEEYPAFISRDLTPGDFLELEPMEDACGILTSTLNIIDDDIGLTIYPNPATDVIELPIDRDNTGIAYQVIATTGKIILEGQLHSNQINISSLQAGFYYLQLYDNNHQYNAKFIKQ